MASFVLASLDPGPLIHGSFSEPGMAYVWGGLPDSHPLPIAAEKYLYPNQEVVLVELHWKCVAVRVMEFTQLAFIFDKCKEQLHCNNSH